MALLVVLGSAAAALRFLGRQGGGPSGDRPPVPTPWIPPEVALEARVRDVLIEAELQDMIAEARAAELTADHEVIPLGL